MIAIDTNILVYAHLGRTPEHAAACRAIETAARHASGWGIALPCVAEFWSVVTHRACAGGPSPANHVAGFLESLERSGAQIWPPGPAFSRRLIQLAGSQEIAGPRIFDLQIGLIAWENGATQMWTHDSAFASPPGLRIVDPLA
jgi:predicted nucleic acid-binding protein